MLSLTADNLKDVDKKYVVKDNTLLAEVKSAPEDRIEIEIGDSKEPDKFLPQVKMMRWDNEVNLSIRAVVDENAEVEIKDGVVKHISANYEVHQYEKPDVSEDGGYEFEWVLKEKPKSNVLEATIQTKGLDFFYQPELTQAEKDEGAERPENVIGSYAVYHSTKSNYKIGDKNYKAGKAFHIYRPKIIDAKGDWTWGEMNIDNGILSVTIPEKWLDSAVYPVVVDPTFGYTSTGGSSNETRKNALVGSIFAGVDGTVEKITARFINMKTDYFEYIEYGYSKAVILDSNGEIITSGVSAGLLFSGMTFGWDDHTFSTEPTVSSSGEYWLTLISSGVDSPPAPSADSLAINYDSGDSEQGVIENNETNSYSSPQDIDGTATYNSRKYSIYATYTASSSGSQPKVKVSGTFVNAVVKQKISGTFTEVDMKAKISGTFK